MTCTWENMMCNQSPRLLQCYQYYNTDSNLLNCQSLWEIEPAGRCQCHFLKCLQVGPAQHCYRQHVSFRLQAWSATQYSHPLQQFVPSLPFLLAFHLAISPQSISQLHSVTRSASAMFIAIIALHIMQQINVMICHISHVVCVTLFYWECFTVDSGER